MREIKVYTLLFWLSFTAVRSQQDVSPPRILNGEEILGNGGPVTLTCEGDEPLVWTYKYLNCHYDMGKQNQTSKTDGSYRSQLTLNGHNSQGHYHCHYNNTSLSDPGASASTYVYLFSDEEDFAEVESDRCQNSTTTRNVGGQVVLDCRPTQPNLTVVVKHGDEEIHRGPLEDPRAGYVLRNLTKGNQGKYKCYIHDHEEPRQFVVRVQETLEPPTLHISKNTFPVVGYDMKLVCQILDNNFQPPPTFTWTQPNRDDITIETAPEHRRVNSHMYYTSNLLIHNVTMEDSGTYKCTVNIKDHSPLQMAQNINIKENQTPFLEVGPVTQNITCTAGEDVLWKFDVESFPPFPIFQTGSEFDVKQNENGTTELKKERVTPSDFGEHSVNLTTRSNPLGLKTAQVYLYLKVKSETELKITGVNATTKPNATITLSCSATGYPMENITWHYQSCPNGVPCPKFFSELEDSQITYEVHKENHHSSECTFVATESARILCRSGKKNESADIVISEFEQPFSFKYSGTGGMKDLQATSNDTSVETDAFTLTCAAAKFYFRNVSLAFSHTDEGVSSGDNEVPVAYKENDLDLIATLDVANVSSIYEGTYKCTGLPKPGVVSSEITLYHKVEALIPVALNTTGNMWPDDHEEIWMAGNAFAFNCFVSGTPVIDISWTKENQPLPSNFGEFRENNQTITIPRLDPKIHSGHYVCEAKNRGGSVRGFLTLTVKVSSKTLEIAIGIITPFIICLVVVVIVLLLKLRRDFQKRCEAEKELAFLFMKGRPTELNPYCTADEQAELLPYDHKWEVSKDRIQLGQQLGAGAFGRVVKATVSNLEPGIPKTAVALKMCKMQADTTQITALTQELKIMIHIGKHLNIVNLMGAYTDNVGKGELWILVEYCQHGNLLQFLHLHRHNFENVIDPITDLVNLGGRDGGESISPLSPVLKSPGSVKSCSDPQSQCEILLESPASTKVLYSSSIFRSGNSFTNRMKMEQNPSYQMAPAANEAALENGPRNHNKKQQSLKVIDSLGNYFIYDKSTIPGVTSPFTTVDLICWSWQVAEGMDYLTHRKVLHGDLAARNLLLAEANVVKISDFGFSRDIYKDDIYLKQTCGPMPVKWMSIEAIRDTIFSVQSDIWSFGVTLWELFSLGSTPYSGVKMDNTFVQSLQDGYRMEKPEYANTDLYKIMCQCWESLPKDRPSFRHLADELSKMLLPETTQYYNTKNGEYLNMNKERFRHETDYLEMLASPDIRHITRDEVSQNEDGEHGTGKSNHDLQMHTESTTSDPDQGTGYLPMSSGTRSPRSFFDIFSPKRTSENFMFTFEEEAQSKNSNPARQSCPHRGIPLHQDKLPSTKSLGDIYIEPQQFPKT